jgi:hypothetical protein
MRSIRPMRSSAWRYSAVLLTCMALSPAAWAQQTGFLVYPKAGAKYGSAIEVVAATCGSYDTKKGGTQEVSCKLTEAAAPKNYSFSAKRQPDVLIFTSPAAGCWCTWGPRGYVCTPPGCR